MSHRRCCCGGGGDCFCFCLEITGTYLQNGKLTCQVAPCFIPTGDETCPTVKSFSVTNTWTTNYGPATEAQDFVVSTPWSGGPNECPDCYGQACVYSYTPTETDFTRDICFRLIGPSWPVQQSSTSGNITAAIVASNVACPGTVWCGCCGTGRAVVEISYEARIPSAMINGDCGEVEFSTDQIFGTRYAWLTGFTLRYCWHYGGLNPDPCTLTLVEIRASSGSVGNSAGIDAGTLDDCDCQADISPTPPTTAKNACAPFTSGLAAQLYAWAGSPPLTLVCSKCSCE